MKNIRLLFLLGASMLASGCGQEAYAQTAGTNGDVVHSSTKHPTPPLHVDVPPLHVIVNIQDSDSAEVQLLLEKIHSALSDYNLQKLSLQTQVEQQLEGSKKIVEDAIVKAKTAMHLGDDYGYDGAARKFVKIPTQAQATVVPATTPPADSKSTQTTTGNQSPAVQNISGDAKIEYHNEASDGLTSPATKPKKP